METPVEAAAPPEMSAAAIDMVQSMWASALGVDWSVIETLCAMAHQYLATKQDAARYRWLRVHECMPIAACYLVDVDSPPPDTAEQLDAEIDRELAKAVAA